MNELIGTDNCSVKAILFSSWQVDSSNLDCGLRIDDCGLKTCSLTSNPQPAIRNPQFFLLRVKLDDELLVGIQRHVGALRDAHEGSLQIRLVELQPRRNLSLR